MEFLNILLNFIILFKKNKMANSVKICSWCYGEFSPDYRNVARGWGKTCSKKCAASLREQNKKTLINSPPENVDVITPIIMTQKSIPVWLL